MNYLHVSSYLSRYAFFVFAETNERCEVRHKFPTRAHALRHGDNQLCWTHPDQLRRRVEAHHCEPTSTRWPPGYSIPSSSSSLTQRVIMLRRAFTSKSQHETGAFPTSILVGKQLQRPSLTRIVVGFLPEYCWDLHPPRWLLFRYRVE